MSIRPNELDLAWYSIQELTGRHDATLTKYNNMSSRIKDLNRRLNTEGSQSKRVQLERQLESHKRSLSDLRYAVKEMLPKEIERAWGNYLWARYVAYGV